MDINELVKKAIEAKKLSYAPYSKFKVGSALLGKSGKVYTGCNIEYASYSPTICAERTAISKAVSEGEREFEAIAVCGDSEYSYPCGVCRQVMREFSKDMKVIVVKSENEYKEHTLEELLPYSFGPEDLQNV
ncbi:cytidine deaminase [Clostridiaceae bacterium M8S5]|nr:cytidine deaminase [Clostridiaceae bacterium M8S5]